MLHEARSHHEQMQKCCHLLSAQTLHEDISKAEYPTGCQREDQEAHPPAVFTALHMAPRGSVRSHAGSACSSRGQLQRREGKRDLALPRNFGPKLKNFLYSQPAGILCGKRRKKHHPGSAQLKGCAVPRRSWRGWPSVTPSLPVRGLFPGSCHEGLVGIKA